MYCDSTMLVWNASRLLSWPAYLWYSHGRLVPSYSVPSVFWYQSVDHDLAVGVEGRDHQEDDVVEDPLRLLVAARDSRS